MKKTLLLLLLAIGSAPAAFAQARPGGSLSSKDYTGGAVTNSRNTGFGAKGGYSLTNFYGSGKDILPGRDNLNTFHAGVYGQFGFNNFSSTQVELLYSRKGVRSKIGGSSAASDLRLDYLSLPILYVGNVTDNISFHIGPQISLLTNVYSGGKNLALDVNGFSSVDFGGVAGAEVRIGPARLGARYDLGLSRVFKKDATYFKEFAGYSGTLTDDNTNIHNRTFQVYIGLGLTQ